MVGAGINRACRLALALGLIYAACPLGGGAAEASSSCGAVFEARQGVAAPGSALAFRAAPIRAAGLHRGIPGAGGRRIGTLRPGLADWLLVLGSARGRGERCWVKLRLPGPPNDAAGWVAAGRLLVRPTPWRLVVSTGRRTLSIYRGGRGLRSFAVVVGAPATPTPRGLFSIVHAWPSEPSSFVGSWVLGLTAHSDVLRRFEGGRGQVGIHGRGGASLEDPLGSAASHGCLRLSNRAIEWLVRTVGRGGLPGVPVLVGA